MLDDGVFDDLEALVRETSPGNIDALDHLVKYDGGCFDYVLDVIVDEDIPVSLQTFRRL